jgi:excisionase family DNA binding protein
MNAEPATHQEAQGNVEMLTTGQVAERLGVTARTIERWLARRVFPGAYRTDPGNPNAHWRIPVHDVRRLEEQRRGASG